MALVENNASRPQIDPESIDMAFVEECLVIKSVSEPRSGRGIQDEPFGSIGINVHQFGHPVGIWCIGLRPQLDGDAAGHFDRLIENGRLISQDIFSVTDSALVHWPFLQEEIPAANGGNWVGGVIPVSVFAFSTVGYLPAESAARKEEIRADSGGRRPRKGSPPLVSGRSRIGDIAHYVILDRRLAHDAVARA